MRTTDLALTLLLCLNACGGGLSKSEAKRLIEEKLGDTTIYGMVEFPTFWLSLRNGKTAAQAFEECDTKGCANFRALRDEGMITISPEPPEDGRATYIVGFTAKGSAYKHETPKRGYQHVRLGRHVVAEVKSIDKQGHEAKVYYTSTFGDATPFAGRVPTWPWGDALDTTSRDMTAELVNDGKAWKVRELRRGTH
jgi:hypothetical protein